VQQHAEIVLQATEQIGLSRHESSHFAARTRLGGLSW
jgi:hypothetical protein